MKRLFINLDRIKQTAIKSVAIFFVLAFIDCEANYQLFDNKEISSIFLDICHFLKVIYSVRVLSWTTNGQVLVSREMHSSFVLIMILVVSPTLTPTADGTRIIDRFGGQSSIPGSLCHYGILRL